MCVKVSRTAPVIVCGACLWVCGRGESEREKGCVGVNVRLCVHICSRMCACERCAFKTFFRDCHCGCLSVCIVTERGLLYMCRWVHAHISVGVRLLQKKKGVHSSFASGCVFT